MRSILAFVDSGDGVIVAPVEPEVFQGGDPIQAFALGGAGDGAALEVPFAGGRSVQQGPRLGTLGWSFCVAIGLPFQEKLGVLAVDAADENAEGFAVEADRN